jgi:hypothetical protein
MLYLEHDHVAIAESSDCLETSGLASYEFAGGDVVSTNTSYRVYHLLDADMCRKIYEAYAVLHR